VFLNNVDTATEDIANACVEEISDRTNKAVIGKNRTTEDRGEKWVDEKVNVNITYIECTFPNWCHGLRKQ